MRLQLSRQCIYVITQRRPHVVRVACRSEAERLALRRARFGIADANTEEVKRLQRAQRFGLVTQETEEAKHEARAARFGSSSKAGAAFAVPATEELEKRRKRAERFQIPSEEGEVRDMPLI